MIKLLKNIKPFRFSVIIIVILVFVQTLTELYLPTLMADIINIGIIEGDIDYIIKVGLFMLGVALIGGATTIAASYLSAKVAVGFGKNIRGKVFKKVTDYSLHEIDKIGTASLIIRSTNDITQVQNVTIMLLRFFIRSPLMAIGSIIMALRMDVPLTGVIVVVVIFMGIVIAIMAGKAIPLFKIVQVKVDQINLVLRERLTGMRVIRAFNKVDCEVERFEKANHELTDVSIKVNKLMALLNPLLMFFFNITTIALVWFGAIRVSGGAMAVGDVMAFMQYGMQIMFSILMMTMVFIMVPRAEVSAVRINEVLDIDSDIKDPKSAAKADQQKGYVEFKDVTFSYHSDHGAEEAAIKDISFVSKPGEVTAIIGGTGSGKSTLINLLPRFYDVDSGEIIIDGENIKDVTMETLRSKIGFVAQKTLLFSGTVRENIRYGNETATDEEIKKALEVAQGLEFVMDMKDGLDAHITQGGTNISGGQKQRLSIARALVRKAEIYIFDDSFSALDFKTEANLRKELLKETTKSTVLIVAQRVTTVMKADRIIVIDNGEAVGIGTHKELFATNQIYKEIVMSQLSEEELA